MKGTGVALTALDMETDGCALKENKDAVGDVINALATAKVREHVADK